jgi:hypothetical protein
VQFSEQQQQQQQQQQLQQQQSVAPPDVNSGFHQPSQQYAGIRQIPMAAGGGGVQRQPVNCGHNYPMHPMGSMMPDGAQFVQGAQFQGSGPQMCGPFMGVGQPIYPQGGGWSPGGPSSWVRPPMMWNSPLEGWHSTCAPASPAFFPPHMNHWNYAPMA